MIPMTDWTGLSIDEIRKHLAHRLGLLPRDTIVRLEQDPRTGVRRIAAQARSLRERLLRENRRLRRLFVIERGLRREGYGLIAGVDEAGVAPLAGPVVAAAVILPPAFSIPGLDDSKKILNPGRREKLANQIKRDAVSWAVGEASVEEIDRLNIFRAALLAMERAVAGLAVMPDFVLVDARTLPSVSVPQRGIIHGDSLSGSIAAASIIAKTSRDACMIELDRQYVGYGFSSHKGYPTPEHCRLLMQKGALPVHRRSFAPVRRALALDPVQYNLFEVP